MHSQRANTRLPPQALGGSCGDALMDTTYRCFPQNNAYNFCRGQTTLDLTKLLDTLDDTPRVAVGIFYLINRMKDKCRYNNKQLP